MRKSKYSSISTTKTNLARRIHSEGCDGVNRLKDTDRKDSSPLVIIADDQRMTRYMIRTILERDNNRVLEAADGKEALKLFEKHHPDLILMDMMMPVMGGREACARIKQTPEGKLVPVLMFTSPESSSKIVQAFEAGASDFISKPIKPDELKHRVARLLHLRKVEMEREKAESQLKKSFDQIQHLSRKILQAYEEERSRLARELHDELGMTLTTLKLNLQIFRSNLDGPDKGEYIEHLDRILEFADDALATIRQKAMTMRTPALDDLGLIAVVDNMLQGVCTQKDMEAALRVEGTPLPLPMEVETSIYRCIQEAVTNAVRHSAAAHLTVTIGFSDEAVTVKIKDDGVGFDLEEKMSSQNHMGLQGMTERVQLLNGNINIESSIGRGTEIRIVIPMSVTKGVLS
jgi:signal transduction histidine kinase